MICIIRIHGQVSLNKGIIETFFRLKLRRKYACIILKPTKENMGMLKKVRNFVAYGEIEKDLLIKLIEQRGKGLEKSKKIDAKKIAEDFEKTGEFKDIKPFFRLHPARGGMETKLGYPKGALGNHGKRINVLLEKML